jgi:hypothetical protein
MWEKEHFNIDTSISETIENLHNKNVDELQIFTGLHDSIKYIDIFHELKEIYPISYLDAKFHQKNIALNSDKIPIEEKNDAFYDWLNVCINSKNDPNIDFYFEKQKPPLSKEDEIKNILFKNGELRDIFKNDEWQIRLKKIKTWFLKRYDLTTSKKIHRNLINRQRFEWVDFFFLRLICAILVGFIPFIFNPEIWDMHINSLHLILSIVLISLIFLYFVYECSKVIDNEKSIIDICARVIPIFFYGLLASFLFSFVFYRVFSEDSAFPIIIGFFLAIIAYFIGVLVQVIWEENTVAEPL